MFGGGMAMQKGRPSPAGAKYPLDSHSAYSAPYSDEGSKVSFMEQASPGAPATGGARSMDGELGRAKSPQPGSARGYRSHATGVAGGNGCGAPSMRRFPVVKFVVVQRIAAPAILAVARPSGVHFRCRDHFAHALEPVEKRRNVIAQVDEQFIRTRRRLLVADAN